MVQKFVVTANFNLKPTIGPPCNSFKLEKAGRVGIRLFFNTSSLSIIRNLRLHNYVI